MAKIKKPKILKSEKSLASAVETEAKSKNEEAEQETPAVVSGQLRKKLMKLQEKNKRMQRGVVFLKNLPHGFFEEQMTRYFEQFGEVTRVRLARSRRTGGSKGYAFVEFELPEVAQVVAETMNNYLMFKRVVKAAYIPPEQQRFNYFKSSVRKVTNKAGKQIYVSGKTAAIQRQVKKTNDWSDENYLKRTKAKLKKIDKLNKKFPDIGIDFKSILIGPKPVAAGTQAKGTAPESKEEDEKENVQSKKPAKRAGASIPNNENKKSKNESIQLEDLLGDTIIEDSDDENFVPQEGDNGSSSDEETYDLKLGENESDSSDDSDDNASEDESHNKRGTANKKSKQVKNTKKQQPSLKDLLEDTTDTSDDEDFEPEENSDETSDYDSEELTGASFDESEESDESSSDKKTSKTKKAPMKKTPSTTGERSDKQVKEKPRRAGIQKPPKKKPKNEMPLNKAKKFKQLELAKEVAKPLAALKKKKNLKQGKKQKA